MTTPITTTEAGEMTGIIDRYITGLEQQTDPAQQAERRADALADFAKGGKYYYAPADEKTRVGAKWDADEKLRQGELLFALGDFTIREEPRIREAIERAKEPAGALESYLRRHATTDQGYTLPLQLHVDMLEELRQGNLWNELRDARPSAILARYNNALEIEDDAVVRFIERHRTRGWYSPTPTTDIKEVTAAQALVRRINQVRDSRVPAEYKAVVDGFGRARKAMQRAQDLFGVTPRNPAHYQKVGA